MTGGSFVDTPNFDPVITNIITEEVYLTSEGSFPIMSLYPVKLGSINRFVEVGGNIRQRLVVVPEQFKATTDAANTVGILRQYSSLDFEVFTSPTTETDFVVPNITAVSATDAYNSVNFQVAVSDESGTIQRVVVLYRYTTESSWSLINLTHNNTTGTATGNIEAKDGTLEYFVQAVDQAGNVALVLDHNDPYSLTLSPAASKDRNVVDSGTSGTLQYTNGSGNMTTASLPNNAVSTATTVVLESQDEPNLAPPAGLVWADHALDIDAYRAGVLQENFTFDNAFDLTISYSDDDVAGLNENDLRIYYQDGAAWIDAATTCTPDSTYNRDTVNNTITVAICHLTHFSLYAPCAAAVAPSVNGAVLGTAVTLSWNNLPLNGAGYQIWKSTNPYFDPAAPGGITAVTELHESWEDSNGAGDAATN